MIRDATSSDVADLALVHVRAFNETHGPGPDRAIRERQWRVKFDSAGHLLFCVVIETEPGEIIGFASGEPHASEELPEFRGVLDKIYLVHEYHGRGLGRRLLCAAARRFIDHRINSMLLFGDARSPANGFYEAMGGERLYAKGGEFHGGFGWRDLQKVASACLADQQT